jgi:hypothetical protein
LRLGTLSILSNLDEPLTFNLGPIRIDNFKAAVEMADRYTPRFNKTFLEYANYWGVLTGRRTTASRER